MTDPIEELKKLVEEWQHRSWAGMYVAAVVACCIEEASRIIPALEKWTKAGAEADREAMVKRVREAAAVAHDPEHEMRGAESRDTGIHVTALVDPELVVEAIRSLAPSDALTELLAEERKKGREIAKKIICAFCAGSVDGTKEVPHRINADNYIPNYGEVQEGDWLHDTDYGVPVQCQAEEVWEAELEATNGE